MGRDNEDGFSRFYGTLVVVNSELVGYVQGKWSLVKPFTDDISMQMIVTKVL